MNTDNQTDKKTGKDIKACTECGESILKKAEICPKCGVRQHLDTELPPQRKEKLTAALLAILLGDIGLHKFYLGQSFTGVLYLLFCWTFVPAVLGLLEGICYLSMKDEDFDKKYNPKSA